jgi:hypothetical protein
MPDTDAVALAIEHLGRLIADGPERLTRVAGTTATIRPQPGAWSKKEELGHLIDSALNNLQRFIRLQQEPTLRMPSYDPDRWVATQRHRTRPWKDLVEEWHLLNRHIVYLLSAVEEHTLEHVWIDGDNATLAFLICDYVAHMRDHLDHIAPQREAAEA